MATPKIVADFETQLATALSIGDTSFTLASATDDDGVALPAGKYYFTINNGNSQKEYVVGTVSGTAVTAVSNVTRQGTESSGVDRAHRVGSSVIISDFLTYKNYIDETTVAGAADADTNTKGVVEGATLAEVRARTALGSTGAALAITPDVADDMPTQDEKAAMAGGGDFGTPSTSNKFLTEDVFASEFEAANTEGASNQTFTPGPMAPTYVKNKFTTPMLFTDATNGGWIFSDPSSDIQVIGGGLQSFFTSAGPASVYAQLSQMRLGSQLNYSTATETMTFDWWAKLPADASSGDILMGMGESSVTSFTEAYNASIRSRIMFTQSGTAIYATVTKGGTGATVTDVSAGVTLTDFNNYRVEMQFGTAAKFYINGTLVHTDSDTANFPDVTDEVTLGFGRSSSAEFAVMAPSVSIEF